jgi:alpha-tubulin suppressor-like RCC1 family protein
MARPTRRFAAVLTACVLATACNSSGSSTARVGELDIVVLSDMALPKDIDRIGIQVTRNGHTLLERKSDVGPDALLLPATFAVKAALDPSPVTIRAVGYKQGETRVERDAVTPIPSGYVGELRLALDYLCVGTVRSQADGGVASSCPDHETCVNGSCESAAVPRAPERASNNSGAATDAGGSKSGCFDVAACFASATSPTVDANRCVATLRDGTDAAMLNVGLRFPAGGAGVCATNECWVALAGWTLHGTELDLPPAACEKASEQGGTLVVTSACNTQDDSTPVCGDWSSVTTTVPEPHAPNTEIAGSCSGPSVQACGQCGTQSRSCTNGTFGSWGPCTGEGVCRPGATQPCGAKGTETCTDACQWAACSCPSDLLTCGATGACASPDDPHTCGSCSNDCTRLPHVTGAVSCSAGQCGFHASACAAGYGDCNGDPADGCETALNTADHCGECAVACTGTDTICDVPSSKAVCASTCSGTLCGSSCVSTDGDVANCGACGHACPNGSSCQSGLCTCTGASSQPCGNCGTQTRSCNDGTWSAFTACAEPAGACAPMSSRSCDGNGSQSCSPDCEWAPCTCSTGYSLCGSACVNEQTDAANCGACGKPCAGTCSGGVCKALANQTPAALAGGGVHTCVIVSGGKIECWGSNEHGQLGNGTTTDSSTPVVAKGVSGAIAVVAGYQHTCALLSGGTVMCWGQANAGELGVPADTKLDTCGDPGSYDSECITTPTAIPNLGGVLAITAGYYTTCALLGGGTVDCWGDNELGEVGSGTAYNAYATPTPVPGITTATAIAAGFEHVCALLAAGTVQCWGDNEYAQVGNTSAASMQTSVCYAGLACAPSPVPAGGLSGVVALAAGGNDACATLSSGAVQCWGDDGSGELGTATAASCPTFDFKKDTFPCDATPLAIPGLAAPLAIAMGGGFQCALVSGGTVACWGLNLDGTLGTGSTVGPSSCSTISIPINENVTAPCATTPVAVSGLTGVRSLAAGYDHVCAVLSDGTVRCWGGNSAGQLGNGTTTGSSTPVKVAL